MRHHRGVIAGVPPGSGASVPHRADRPPRRRVLRLGADLGLAFGAVAAVTLGGRWAGLNSAGAGFLYLTLVLLLAVGRGLAAALGAALLATAAFNFAFLPPLHTFTIAEPSNWIALASFLVAASVGSRLIAALEHRAAEASARQREVEMLYELCFGLLTADPAASPVERGAIRALDIVRARGGGLYLPGGEASEVIEGDDPRAREDLARAAAGELVTRPLPGEEPLRDAFVPLHLGRETSGVLVVRGTAASDAVLEPAGQLLALARERERVLAEAALAEAAQQSDALKTALLRAVSHDLRTPLTAIGIELDALRAALGDSAAAGPRMRSLARAANRLTRRIDNLLTMARLESGTARPRPEPVPPGTLFRGAREALALLLEGRVLATRVAADCPDLLVDPALGLEILVNLLENAARIAPESPLELVAEPAPGGAALRLEVRDRGPGVPEVVARHHAPLGQRETLAPELGSGLGLEIVRSLVTASDGTFQLLPREGGGTVARVELPAAPALAEETT